jgi:hypothetical protein
LDEGLKLIPEIRPISEEEKRRAILEVLELAASRDAVRQLWVSDSS